MGLKSTIVMVGVAIAALTGPAMAGTNILPGSGDTVAGSSIHSGFDPTVAGGNLINGTNNAAFFNGDSRWVFADGSSADQTLTVDLGSAKSVNLAGFSYSGADRGPTSFEVLTSLDDVTFTPVAGPNTPAFGSNSLLSDNLSFSPTLAKFVEFDFGANSLDSGCPGCGGGIGQGAGIVQLDIQAVPEPATWAMLMLGIGAIGLVARRRSPRALIA